MCSFLLCGSHIVYPIIHELVFSPPWFEIRPCAPLRASHTLVLWMQALLFMLRSDIFSTDFLKGFVIIERNILPKYQLNFINLDMSFSDGQAGSSSSCRSFSVLVESHPKRCPTGDYSGLNWSIENFIIMNKFLHRLLYVILYVRTAERRGWPYVCVCGFIIIIENIFIMRNLTDMLRTVETGVDPHLCVMFCRHLHLLLWCLTNTHKHVK